MKFVDTTILSVTFLSVTFIGVISEIFFSEVKVTYMMIQMTIKSVQSWTNLLEQNGEIQ